MVDLPVWKMHMVTHSPHTANRYILFDMHSFFFFFLIYLSTYTDQKISYIIDTRLSSFP